MTIFDLRNSYIQCINRMDIGSVKPWNEFDVQFSYSKIWYDVVIQKLLTIDNFDPLNPSVLRSMLIMDLIDCHYLGVDKKPIFTWYLQQIKKHYAEDYFSIKVNKPVKYNSKLSDYTYFTNTSENLKLMQRLYEYSYFKYQDIFADNAYEVCGPYYENNRTFLITFFRNIVDNQEFKFIQFGNGKIDGVVDLFGHSDFHLNHCTLEINENITLLDDEMKFQITDDRTDIEKYIDSRCMRVKSIFNDYEYENLKKKIAESFSYNPQSIEINNLLSL